MDSTDRAEGLQGAYSQYTPSRTAVVTTFLIVHGPGYSHAIRQRKLWAGL